MLAALRIPELLSREPWTASWLVSAGYLLALVIISVWFVFYMRRVRRAQAANRQRWGVGATG